MFKAEPLGSITVYHKASSIVLPREESTATLLTDYHCIRDFHKLNLSYKMEGGKCMNRCFLSWHNEFGRKTHSIFLKNRAFPHMKYYQILWCWCLLSLILSPGQSVLVVSWQHITLCKNYFQKVNDKNWNWSISAHNLCKPRGTLDSY